jgi:phosphomannomutase / phosphoglucomutase
MTMTDAKKNPVPNTESYEREILISSSGFREYDARWLYPEQINLRGLNQLGMAIGTMIHDAGIEPKIVVGHDYRSYSATIKQAVIVGLMASGCKVQDIGLALSPVAYFGQFHLDCPAVAMVTASHNENGWTGVKMGMERPLTFGPDRMTQLKDMATNGQVKARAGGTYTYVDNIREAYINDLVRDGPVKRKIKAVVACGNGTAGIYAPDVLRRLGVDVIEMDCALDYTFPHYNPNPEDLEMLHALAARVKETGADVGLAFDGDGDRCGVVDNTGEEIFADKVGVMLARDLAKIYPNAQFVVDVKSTGLYLTDPELIKHGAKTDYWKTGHSYIKRRVHELNALVGFEKSGHFFFNAPLGKGYDDGIVSAIAVCRFLDRNAGKSMEDLKNSLPRTYSSPTMAPFCPDDRKYKIVELVTAVFENMAKSDTQILGQSIRSVVTVNGVRVTLDDGTWGLIRASSNKPSLVVVVESPVSEQCLHDMFHVMDAELRKFPEVGEYDQKLKAAA